MGTPRSRKPLSGLNRPHSRGTSDGHENGDLAPPLFRPPGMGRPAYGVASSSRRFPYADQRQPRQTRSAPAPTQQSFAPGSRPSFVRVLTTSAALSET